MRVTCELADRFKSKVIGVTAGLANVPIHADGMIASSVLEADYEELNRAIGRCESHFRSALKDFSGPLEWRSDAAYPADFLAQEARAAGSAGGRPRRELLGARPDHLLDIGDAVMKAGRPILVVPPRSTSLALNRIADRLEGFRRARKAIPAALPLLKQATESTIVEIVPTRASEAPQTNVSPTWRNGFSAMTFGRRHGSSCPPVTPAASSTPSRPKPGLILSWPGRTDILACRNGYSAG